MMLHSRITDAFDLPGRVLSSPPFGNGLINDTYLVTTDATHLPHGNRFIFQRINHHIFKDPLALMSNVQRVCRHIKSVLEFENALESQRRHLNLVHTKTGGIIHHETQHGDDNETSQFWRCYNYIEDSTSHETVDSPNIAYEAARQFGEFQRLLSSLNGGRLHETIPQFHHTPGRFNALQNAIRTDPLERVRSCTAEIRFANDHEAIAHRLLGLHQLGLVPERITHNDTKISNVLICNESRKGLCVVDLDTVMPGLSLYDFGDLIRSSVSPASEDSTDLGAIEVRLPFYEALATGFLEAMADTLTPAERDHLAFSGILITYELGLRFLTDYLLGDTYFGAKRPAHNLERTRNQFELTRQLIIREAEMKSLTPFATR